MALEHARRHGSRVICRDVKTKAHDSILIDALLAEVYAFPVGERGPSVVGERVRRHKIEIDGCVLLQHLVLE